MRNAGKVLVVDDYETNRRGLSALLKSASYNVVSASNGSVPIWWSWTC
jgi:CheY-like chemotaxis protein